MIDFNNSQLHRRLAVDIVHISLLAMYGLWVPMLMYGYTLQLGISFALIAILGTVFYHLAIVKTGIRKLVKTNISDLDEREREVVLNATRISYRVFTIGCIVFAFLYIAVRGYIEDQTEIAFSLSSSSISLLILSVLIGMSESLPGSIIA